MMHNEKKKWNFHWQDEYRYTTPFALPRGTTVSMRFEYANSGDGGASPPHRVVYGPRSSDEMSDLWLQVLPRTPADRATLQAELARRETLADIAGFETLLRARPDDGPTRTLLGSLYMRVGRHADAQRELRTALEALIQPSIARKVVSEFARLGAAMPKDAPPLDALSERELDVLRLLAQGLSNREIAERLFISEGTAKNHVSNILSKMSVRDRTQAALLARQRGWV